MRHAALYWRHALGAALALGALLACSGEAFESGNATCSGSGCGAEASSGANGGGSGGGMTEPSPFPATVVLDDFNRMGPGIGENWHGAADEFSLVEQALWCELCGSATLWSQEFGPEQEVHATLAGFDGDAGEINLVLKAQEPNCEMIEVLYSPANQALRIAHCSAGQWTDLDAKMLDLQPGDRLGGRALADNTVEVYVNDALFTTFDVSAFPYEKGRIGVNGISADNGLYWDDFGGGNWN